MTQLAQEMALRILGLDHIVLRARDAGRLVRFYCDVLGCTVEKRQDKIGLIQLRAGSALIDIVGIDGELGRMRRRAARAATSITSRSVSRGSTPRRCATIWRATTSTWARSSCAMVPAARGRRSISRTRKATWSN
jgi:hypothetical protein